MDDALVPWFGRQIVLDLESPYVIVGVLLECGPQHLRLKDADVHDLRDTTTTRDLYVLDASRHGVNVNRKEVLVERKQVVSISLLEDVVV